MDRPQITQEIIDRSTAAVERNTALHAACERAAREIVNEPFLANSSVVDVESRIASIIYRAFREAKEL